MNARRRWSTALLLMTLAASPLLSVGIVGAHEGHEPRIEGDDPHAYRDPHAGYVAPPRAQGRLVPPAGALLGTHSDDNHSGELTPEDQGILVTEQISGRRMDIDNSYYGGFSDIADDWEPGNPNKRGLSKLAFWDVEMGRIPLVGWGCAKSTEVTAGKHDTTIRKTAEAMKAFGHEFFMRYCWEMDGDKRSEPGKSHEFTAAWIHIWKIFQEVGADNVVWVWCANANSFKNQTDNGEWAWDYYPGDEYVDWVSADGYNWAASHRNRDDNYEKDRWRGMVEIFDEFMTWARWTPASGPVPESMRFDWDDDTGRPDPTKPTGVPEAFPRKGAVKPIMIGEYGAIQPEGSIADHYLDIAPYNTKQEWLRETHDTVNGNKSKDWSMDGCHWCGIYSDIAAMVYFDIEGPNGNWHIHSYPESEAAWREAAQDPWFKQIHSTGWASAGNTDYQPTPLTDPGPTTTTAPSTSTTTQQGVVAGSGYWMLGAGGTVYPFGSAGRHGDAPVGPGAGVIAVDIEPTPAGAGYWIVDSTGRVSVHGDAAHFGNLAAGTLGTGETVTSLSATPAGKGYWIFTTKGRSVAFGDASHHGDMAAVKLNGPVLDSIPTPSGKGYYMVGSDGGIFAFGDAKFAGSMGGKPLNAPVQSLVPDRDGAGYWLVAADGGIFAFDAPFRGSMGASKLNKPVTGMVPYGNGYLMVAEDGGIFNFSDLPFSGSLGDQAIPRPIVAVAPLAE